MADSFKRYEDVPVIISDPGLKVSQQIFARSCSVGLNQDIAAKKYAGDYNPPLCQEIYDNGDFTGLRFTKNQKKTVLLGTRIEGTPGLGDGLKVGVPVPTSIENIPSGTIISFPNDEAPSIFGATRYHSGNLLYVSGDATAGDYYIDVYPEKDMNLTGSDCSRGYMNVKRNYCAGGPVQGSLDISFYLNTGSLQSFFNVTGLWGPYQYPPTNEERVEIQVGDYVFHNAYLNKLEFSVSPNSPVEASASFQIYGSGQYTSGYSEEYFQPYKSEQRLYNEQLAVPHGTTSKVDAKAVGIRHPISFVYEVSVERTPDFEIPQSGIGDEGGELPSRVSKGATRMTAKIRGEHLDPHLSINGSRAAITIQLKDMSYSDFVDNSAGLMQDFKVDGVVTSQNLDVSDGGYLGGEVAVMEEYR